jgi:3-hydroxyisobutyrate dehydrogenase-like beta-hydroxyacid dehydrogenase
MLIQTVGILSPGDMGQAIATVLLQHQLQVVAALNNRSNRTRFLAIEAGIQDVGSLERLVSESDLILSVLVPSVAVQVAHQVAEAIANVGKPILYADCNAIAPHKAIAIDHLIRDAGGQFVDAAIIGPPPRVPNRTRIYAAGEQAEAFAHLQNYGLDVRVIGNQVGQASGLKMCYAALTKGLTALGTELLIAAHRLGLEEPLWQELNTSQQELLAILSRSIPGMTPKAHRWIGEMLEIADTFGQVELTERTFQGAADIYQLVKQTSLGQETPEERDPSRALRDVIAILEQESRAQSVAIAPHAVSASH